MSALAARHLTDLFLLHPNQRQSRRTHRAPRHWALEIDPASQSAFAVGLAIGPQAEVTPEEEDASTASGLPREHLFDLAGVKAIVHHAAAPGAMTIKVRPPMIPLQETEPHQGMDTPFVMDWRPNARGASAPVADAESDLLSFSLVFASESEARAATVALIAACPLAEVRDDCEASLSASRTSYTCRFVVFRDPFEAHRCVIADGLPGEAAKGALGVELYGQVVIDTRYGALELWGEELPLEEATGNRPGSDRALQGTDFTPSQAETHGPDAALRMAIDDDTTTSEEEGDNETITANATGGQGTMNGIRVTGVPASSRAHRAAAAARGFAGSKVQIAPGARFGERQRHGQAPVVDAAFGTRSAMGVGALSGPPGEHSFIDLDPDDGGRLSPRNRASSGQIPRATSGGIRPEGLAPLQVGGNSGVTFVPSSSAALESHFGGKTVDSDSDAASVDRLTSGDDAAAPTAAAVAAAIKRAAKRAEGRDGMSDNQWYRGHRPRQLRLLCSEAVLRCTGVITGRWGESPTVHVFLGTALAGSVVGAHLIGLSVLMPSITLAQRFAARMRAASGCAPPLPPPLAPPSAADLAEGVSAALTAYRPVITAALVAWAQHPAQAPVTTAAPLAGGGGEDGSDSAQPQTDVFSRARRRLAALERCLLHRLVDVADMAEHAYNASVVAAGASSSPDTEQTPTTASSPADLNKPLRVHAASWPVGGRPPPAPTALADWLPPESADVYAVTLTDVALWHKWRWVRAIERLLTSCPMPQSLRHVGREGVKAAAAAAAAAARQSVSVWNGAASGGESEWNSRPHTESWDRMQVPPTPAVTREMRAGRSDEASLTMGLGRRGLRETAQWEHGALGGARGLDTPQHQRPSRDRQADASGLDPVGARVALADLEDALTESPEQRTERRKARRAARGARGMLSPVQADAAARVSAALTALRTRERYAVRASAEALVVAPPATRRAMRVAQREVHSRADAEADEATAWRSSRVRQAVESLVSATLAGPLALKEWVTGADDVGPRSERAISRRAMLAATLHRQQEQELAAQSARNGQGSIAGEGRRGGLPMGRARATTADAAIAGLIMGSSRGLGAGSPMEDVAEEQTEMHPTMGSPTFSRMSSAGVGVGVPPAMRAMSSSAGTALGDGGGTPGGSSTGGGGGTPRAGGGVGTGAPAGWRTASVPEMAASQWRTLRVLWNRGVLMVVCIRASRLPEVSCLRSSFVERGVDGEEAGDAGMIGADGSDVTATDDGRRSRGRNEAAEAAQAEADAVSGGGGGADGGSHRLAATVRAVGGWSSSGSKRARDPTCIGGLAPLQPDDRVPCAIGVAIEMSNSASLALVGMQLTAGVAQGGRRERQTRGLLSALSTALPRSGVSSIGVETTGARYAGGGGASDRGASGDSKSAAASSAAAAASSSSKAGGSNSSNRASAGASGDGHATGKGLLNRRATIKSKTLCTPTSDGAALWTEHDAVFVMGDLGYTVEGAASAEARIAARGLAFRLAERLTGRRSVLASGRFHPTVSHRALLAMATLPRPVIPITPPTLPGRFPGTETRMPAVTLSTAAAAAATAGAGWFLAGYAAPHRGFEAAAVLGLSVELTSTQVAVATRRAALEGAGLLADKLEDVGRHAEKALKAIAARNAARAVADAAEAEEAAFREDEAERLSMQHADSGNRNERAAAVTFEGDFDTASTIGGVSRAPESRRFGAGGFETGKTADGPLTRSQLSSSTVGVLSVGPGQQQQHQPVDSDGIMRQSTMPEFSSEGDGVKRRAAVSRMTSARTGPGRSRRTMRGGRGGRGGGSLPPHLRAMMRIQSGAKLGGPGAPSPSAGGDGVMKRKASRGRLGRRPRGRGRGMGQKKRSAIKFDVVGGAGTDMPPSRGPATAPAGGSQRTGQVAGRRGRLNGRDGSSRPARNGRELWRSVKNRIRLIGALELAKQSHKAEKMVALSGPNAGRVGSGAAAAGGRGEGGRDAVDAGGGGGGIDFIRDAADDPTVLSSFSAEGAEANRIRSQQQKRGAGGGLAGPVRTSKTTPRAPPSRARGVAGPGVVDKAATAAAAESLGEGHLHLQATADGDGAGDGMTKLYLIEVRLPGSVTGVVSSSTKRSSSRSRKNKKKSEDTSEQVWGGGALLPHETGSWTVRRSLQEFEALYRRLQAFATLYDSRTGAALEVARADELELRTVRRARKGRKGAWIPDEAGAGLMEAGARGLPAASVHSGDRLATAYASAASPPPLPEFPALKPTAASRLRRALFKKRRVALQAWLAAVVARPAAWACPHLALFLDRKQRAGPLWRLLHLPWARLAAHQRAAAAAAAKRLMERPGTTAGTAEQREAVRGMRLRQLVARDGLRLSQMRGGTLAGWQEGSLVFAPTFPLVSDASLSRTTGGGPEAAVIEEVSSWSREVQAASEAIIKAPQPSSPLAPHGYSHSDESGALSSFVAQTRRGRRNSVEMPGGSSPFAGTMEGSVPSLVGWVGRTRKDTLLGDGEATPAPARRALAASKRTSTIDPSAIPAHPRPIESAVESLVRSDAIEMFLSYAQEASTIISDARAIRTSYELDLDASGSVVTDVPGSPERGGAPHAMPKTHTRKRSGLSIAARLGGLFSRSIKTQPDSKEAEAAGNSTNTGREARPASVLPKARGQLARSMRDLGAAALAGGSSSESEENEEEDGWEGSTTGPGRNAAAGASPIAAKESRPREFFAERQASQPGFFAPPTASMPGTKGTLGTGVTGHATASTAIASASLPAASLVPVASGLGFRGRATPLSACEGLAELPFPDSKEALGDGLAQAALPAAVSAKSMYAAGDARALTSSGPLAGLPGWRSRVLWRLSEGRAWSGRVKLLAYGSSGVAVGGMAASSWVASHATSTAARASRKPASRANPLKALVGRSLAGQERARGVWLVGGGEGQDRQQSAPQDDADQLQISTAAPSVFPLTAPVAAVFDVLVPVPQTVLAEDRFVKAVAGGRQRLAVAETALAAATHAAASVLPGVDPPTRIKVVEELQQAVALAMPNRGAGCRPVKSHASQLLTVSRDALISRTGVGVLPVRDSKTGVVAVGDASHRFSIHGSAGIDLVGLSLVMPSLETAGQSAQVSSDAAPKRGGAVRIAGLPGAVPADIGSRRDFDGKPLRGSTTKVSAPGKVRLRVWAPGWGTSAVQTGMVHGKTMEGSKMRAVLHSAAEAELGRQVTTQELPALADHFAGDADADGAISSPWTGNDDGAGSVASSVAAAMPAGFTAGRVLGGGTAPASRQTKGRGAMTELHSQHEVQSAVAMLATRVKTDESASTKPRRQQAGAAPRQSPRKRVGLSAEAGETSGRTARGTVFEWLDGSLPQMQSAIGDARFLSGLGLRVEVHATSWPDNTESLPANHSEGTSTLVGTAVIGLRTLLDHGFVEPDEGGVAALPKQVEDGACKALTMLANPELAGRAGGTDGAAPRLIAEARAAKQRIIVKEHAARLLAQAAKPNGLPAAARMDLDTLATAVERGDRLDQSASGDAGEEAFADNDELDDDFVEAMGGGHDREMLEALTGSTKRAVPHAQTRFEHETAGDDVDTTYPGVDGVGASDTPQDGQSTVDGQESERVDGGTASDREAAATAEAIATSFGVGGQGSSSGVSNRFSVPVWRVGHVVGWLRGRIRLECSESEAGRAMRASLLAAIAARGAAERKGSTGALFSACRGVVTAVANAAAEATAVEAAQDASPGLPNMMERAEMLHTAAQTASARVMDQLEALAASEEGGVARHQLLLQLTPNSLSLRLQHSLGRIANLGGLPAARALMGALTILVPATARRRDAKKEYTTYIVEVGLGRARWRCAHRFVAFEKLDAIIRQDVESLPGMPVAGLPTPPHRFRVSSSSVPGFVERRRLSLQHYLQQLALCPAAWAGGALRAFLDSPACHIQVALEVAKVMRASLRSRRATEHSARLTFPGAGGEPAAITARRAPGATVPGSHEPELLLVSAGSSALAAATISSSAIQSRRQPVPPMRAIRMGQAIQQALARRAARAQTFATQESTASHRGARFPELSPATDLPVSAAAQAPRRKPPPAPGRRTQGTPLEPPGSATRPGSKARTFGSMRRQVVDVPKPEPKQSSSQQLEIDEEVKTSPPPSEEEKRRANAKMARTKQLVRLLTQLQGESESSQDDSDDRSDYDDAAVSSPEPAIPPSSSPDGSRPWQSWSAAGVERQTGTDDYDEMDGSWLADEVRADVDAEAMASRASAIRPGPRTRLGVAHMPSPITDRGALRLKGKAAGVTQSASAEGDSDGSNSDGSRASVHHVPQHSSTRTDTKTTRRVHQSQTVGLSAIAAAAATTSSPQSTSSSSRASLKHHKWDGNDPVASTVAAIADDMEDAVEEAAACRGISVSQMTFDEIRSVRTKAARLAYKHHVSERVRQSRREASETPGSLRGHSVSHTRHEDTHDDTAPGGDAWAQAMFPNKHRSHVMASHGVQPVNTELPGANHDTGDAESIASDEDGMSVFTRSEFGGDDDDDDDDGTTGRGRVQAVSPAGAGTTLGSGTSGSLARNAIKAGTDRVRTIPQDSDSDSDDAWTQGSGSVRGGQPVRTGGSNRRGPQAAAGVSGSAFFVTVPDSKSLPQSPTSHPAATPMAKNPLWSSHDNGDSQDMLPPRSDALGMHAGMAYTQDSELEALIAEAARQVNRAISPASADMPDSDTGSHVQDDGEESDLPHHETMREDDDPSGTKAATQPQRNQAPHPVRVDLGQHVAPASSNGGSTDAEILAAVAAGGTALRDVENLRADGVRAGAAAFVTQALSAATSPIAEVRARLPFPDAGVGNGSLLVPPEVVSRLAHVYEDNASERLAETVGELDGGAADDDLVAASEARSGTTVSAQPAAWPPSVSSSGRQRSRSPQANRVALSAMRARRMQQGGDLVVDLSRRRAKAAAKAAGTQETSTAASTRHATGARSTEGRRRQHPPARPPPRRA